MSDRFRELFELTRVRVLLFGREPEAIFWVFVFPLVLAAVLGFAFRSKGIEPARVGLVEGAGTAQLASALERDEHIQLVRFPTREEGRKKLARAALDVLLEAGSDQEIAVGGQAADEELERCFLSGLARFPVAGGHGELVKVREERVHQRLISSCRLFSRPASAVALP